MKKSSSWKYGNLSLSQYNFFDCLSSSLLPLFLKMLQILNYLWIIQNEIWIIYGYYLEHKKL